MAEAWQCSTTLQIVNVFALGGEMGLLLFTEVLFHNINQAIVRVGLGVFGMSISNRDKQLSHRFRAK